MLPSPSTLSEYELISWGIFPNFDVGHLSGFATRAFIVVLHVPPGTSVASLLYLRCPVIVYLT